MFVARNHYEVYTCLYDSGLLINIVDLIEPNLLGEEDEDGDCSVRPIVHIALIF